MFLMSGCSTNNLKRFSGPVLIAQIWIVMVFASISTIYAFPEFSSNDAFLLFSWIRNASDTYNSGYKMISRVKSQVTRKDSLIVDAALRVEGFPKWYDYVANTYSSLGITFTSSKPSNVLNCTQAYVQCPWLLKLHLALDKENHTINFPFPIPDQAKPYHKYDYFTIAVNDSIHLRFQGVQDSLFMGSFLNVKMRNSPDNWLIAKAAVMIHTSNNTPFRIRSIELSAKYKDLLKEYLGFDLSRLSSSCDYYGMDFIDTTITEQVISVLNVAIPNRTNVIVDSTYTITWLTQGKEFIQSCSLYVRYNDEVLWQPLGKTSGTTEMYTWLIPDNGKKTCQIQVCATGLAGQRVSAVSNNYSITQNSVFQLQATSLSNTSVQLKWNPLGINQANASSLVIAYSSNSVIISYPNEKSSMVNYGLTTDSDTIENLQTGITYYFSLFVRRKDGLYVLASPFAIDSALIVDRTPPQNPYSLSSYADSSGIRLLWQSALPIPADADSIGLFICEFHYPVSYDDPDSRNIKRLLIKDSVYTVTDLKIDKTYYFALMVKDSSGNWSEPTDKSISKNRLSVSSSVNAVTITPAGVQKLFNDSLHIWNTSDITFMDTIDRWEGPLKGFLPISQGFMFRNGNRISKPLWVKVPIILNMKSDKIVKIMLYSYDTYKGGWLVSHDTVLVDTINGVVSARNTLPSLPFMFLLDTLAPVIKISGKKNTPISSQERIKDTIYITDNVKNVTSRFFASPGNASPWDLSMYISPVDTVKTPQIYILTTPPGIADECMGIRAFVKTTDMVNDVTVNLSKPVLRRNGNCDNLTTVPLQWAPLLVSAQPDYPEFSSVMKNSLNIASWAYDTNDLRIIKWIPGHKAAFDGGWVQYGNVADSLFKIKQGTLIWIKTKKKIDINFGAATVPSLIDSFSIKILPEQWADISNPYPFDVHVGDVLKASKGYADSLEIYFWDGKEGHFQTKQLYLAGMPGLQSSMDTIKGLKPYSIFNPGKNPITLKIPPVCVPASMLAKKDEILYKKKQDKRMWSIRIDSWGDKCEILPSVYCGHNSILTKDITYCTPPTFSQQRVTVYDQKKKLKWGSVVSSKGAENGSFFELLFENNSNFPVAMQSLVTSRFGIDESQQIKWFNTETNAWVDARDTVRIFLKKKQTRKRVIAVGTETYFKDLGFRLRQNILAFHSVYPNPFKRSFMIEYMLPYNTEKVSFMIYNLKGQLLWKKDLIDITPGLSSLKMDNVFATGIYILQMRVKEENAGSPKVLNREVMCLN